MQTSIEKAKEYSLYIQKLEFEYFDYQIEREIIQEKIALFNAQLELKIYQDKTLSNENMRKAQKIVLQSQDNEHLQLLAALKTINGRIKRSLINLEKYKREFSILKLEAKQEIARQLDLAA